MYFGLLLNSVTAQGDIELINEELNNCTQKPSV
jgi:hypothetical protein